MKTSLRLVCIAVSVFCTMFGTGQVTGQSIGDGYFANTAPVHGMTDVHLAWPGRVWFQANLADSGLGYNGTYFTLGAKQHVFQDHLDGRWLLEARGHWGTEADTDGFFFNIGLERVFSLYAAGAEITTGAWFDWDEDLQGDFAHTMTAIGANVQVETEGWIAYGNGYFPVGDSNFQLGDPLNGGCFVNNLLVTHAAIDTALQGFDAMFLAKPRGLRHVNGTFGIGGYHYSSPLIESFAGIRGRAGVQFDGGIIVQGELNHDDRFDLTGVLQIGWLFGTGAKGTEYGFLGTDLDPTIRNDHVVRFQQSLQVAIDPDTGRAYNVFHVDNTAAAGGDGTFERPFDNLAAAETASVDDDIIFVREGDGTTRNMNMGIELNNGQLLLGDGVRHLIPLADGTNFVLCNNEDGNLPTISNDGFGSAVTLASRNTVRGFNIDGTGVDMTYGIYGDGGMVNDGGIIEDVNIFGQPVLDGIHLNNIAGDWTFARNNIQTARENGIEIINALDPTSNYRFVDNVVNMNGFGSLSPDGWDGINMTNYDARSLTFIDNDTSFNFRDGISLNDFQNASGAGAILTFIDTEIAAVIPNGSTPTAEGNGRYGINLVNFSGDVSFLNMEMRDNQNNQGGAINMINVQTPLAGQEVFIGTTGAGQSLFINNGAGSGGAIFNELDVINGIQRLVITDSTLQGNSQGIWSRATATGADLFTDIIDNNSITLTQTDAIRLGAFAGATHRARVTNTGLTPLLIDQTGFNGIVVEAADGPGVSLMEAEIENVLITNTGLNGIRGRITEQGTVITRLMNTTITDSGNDHIQIRADNDAGLNSTNIFTFENLTLLRAGDDGIDLNVGTDTWLDFQLTNSTLNNFVPGNPTLGDTGVEVAVFGEDTGFNAADLDTQVRLNIIENTITFFDAIGGDGGDGIGVITTGDARVLANIESNIITNSGPDNVLPPGIVPESRAIDIQTRDASHVFTQIRNNRIEANAGGVRLQNGLPGAVPLDESSITAVVVRNEMQSFGAENHTNAIGTGICLASTENFLTGAMVLNNVEGGALNFRHEVNVLSEPEAPAGNLVYLPDISFFDIQSFGTQCQFDINAEASVFFTPR